MSRRLLILLLLVCASLAIGACQKAADDQVATRLAPPTDINDTEGWKKYVQDVVKTYIPAGQSARPFVTFVEAAPTEERTNQFITNTRNFLLRGVAEGTLLPFASPDSALMADIVEQAFREPQAGKLKGSKVLFIGTAEYRDRVREAVTAWGADFAFHEAR